VTDLTRLGLVEVAAMIRAGSVRSVEVTEAVLAAAERAQKRTHCFLEIESDSALAAARAADLARERGAALGPLHGVPLAHKDMYPKAGHRIRYGSRVAGTVLATRTAAAVERLEAAGAISIGALNMAEFALGPSGHNASLGDCRNAIDPTYMAGGSSSGSGAAVASCAVYGSLGSDTGGSVRIPAAANGVVGLKATYGRISRHGAMKLSPSLDVVGPLARSVRDCARLLNVLAGHDARDSGSSRLPVIDYERDLERDIAGLRIGIPRQYFLATATDDVRAAMQASLAGLEAQGAVLVEVDLPGIDAMAELNRVVVYAEATATHAAWLASRADRYSPQVRVRASTGLGIPAPVYLEALMLRAPLLERFVRGVFAQCDVLHTPTLPIPVPRLADVDVGAGAGLWSAIAQLVHCTGPFNYLGLPAISVPGIATRNGMPSSVQLIARPFAEGLVLRVAAAHERAHAARAAGGVLAG
jgi:aspartyl-tRNA(Asn)/glutamyl-tRNA(Gln) amidotransferase subunit A